VSHHAQPLSFKNVKSSKHLVASNFVLHWFALFPWDLKSFGLNYMFHTSWIWPKTTQGEFEMVWLRSTGCEQCRLSRTGHLAVCQRRHRQLDPLAALPLHSPSALERAELSWTFILHQQHLSPARHRTALCWWPPKRGFSSFAICIRRKNAKGFQRLWTV
jgi:hypothetical protein